MGLEVRTLALFISIRVFSSGQEFAALGGRKCIYMGLIAYIAIPTAAHKPLCSTTGGGQKPSIVLLLLLQQYEYAHK